MFFYELIETADLADYLLEDFDFETSDYRTETLLVTVANGEKDYFEEVKKELETQYNKLLQQLDEEEQKHYIQRKILADKFIDVLIIISDLEKNISNCSDEELKLINDILWELSNWGIKQNLDSRLVEPVSELEDISRAEDLRRRK